jgi:CHASE2 domain-containing sensor protein/two-component sensor histidine kinase
MVTPKETSLAWKQLSRASWQRRVLPGLTVIGLVLLARVLGFFQEVEWNTLDAFLRLRPAEPQDERILIVGINERDIQRAGTYPIPDADLAALLEKLLQANPRVIGIDIFRDLPVEPGSAILADTLKNTSNVYGIEKINGEPVPPPAALPPERVGFNDFPLDEDGFVRRALLGALPPIQVQDPDRFRFAFPLILAKAYLAEAGLILENGRHDPRNMRFGDTELFAVRPHSGAYVNANATGVQILINVRSGQTPFQTVSMTEVLTDQVDADLIRDRIVIIGITSLSAKDLVNSAAVNTINPGLFYGVEMHAHVTSQIVSAVLDNRPLLRVWADPWEYLWIVLWGGMGMVLVRFIPRPALHMLSVGVIGLGLVGLSLILLWVGGWWIPVMPTLVAFTVNGLILPVFYLYDQTLRSRIAERQRVIEETYDSIHNGPLQTLALLLRQKDTLAPEVGTQLTNLNQELREVYNRLQQESLPQEDQLQLGSQHIVDLRNPLHEVLYEVYTETLRRDFPGFDTIKFQIVKFEPFREEGLTTNDRRSLCRFLEEMLCNVGKHAVGAKRLSVLCMATATENLIRVEDNGKGASPSPPGASSALPAHSESGGRGTQQAEDLAQRLSGYFARTFGETGTCCELRWPLRVPRSWWQR